MARDDRRHSDKRPDNRRPFERDRDRLLYSSAFRRLAGITQVVAASEGDVYHNRLTHTLKVAQVGSRLAEKLLRENDSVAGVLDADVVEAAALAHDIGHPPFGHAIEMELRALLQASATAGTFEGNAQSFRIVTQNATMSEQHPGLNLTRATLAAILKYPFMHSDDGTKASRKWGAYPTEEDDFRFALELGPGDALPSASRPQTLEAEIMDWSDDITYAVHDVEDLWRAGLLPVDRLRVSEAARNEFAEWVFSRWQGEQRPAPLETIRGALEVLTLFGGVEPYEGSRKQRFAIRYFVSLLVGRYVAATELAQRTDGTWHLAIAPRYRMEIEVMKQLVWRFVIDKPALTGQQEGQKEVVRKVYATFMDAASSESRVDRALLPVRLAETLTALNSTAGVSNQAQRARLVVDTICSMTDNEIISTYRRLTGMDLGSVVMPR